ncbi:hypothetical protein APF79_05410 [bacterium BRH_c32]|nr:MAG: hypothetical protein APF79_05410 [bacterium BRH_c32]
MKNIFLLIILSASLIYSQITTGSIKGRVVAADNSPLEGVNVFIPGTNYGDATDKRGFFEIKNLPLGIYNIEFSLIGYKKEVKENINLNQASINLNIILYEAAFETKQIIVSAGKYQQNKDDLSVSTTVLKPEMISQKNITSFDDLLRYVPGVQMTMDQVSIRGSSGYSKGAGTRVLTAIDGVPFYSGDMGDIVWEMIPLQDIERIEVIKGPASSLYGSTAIGGVINIITKNASKNPFTNFRSYIGSYDKPSYDIWKWDDSYRAFYGLSLTHSNHYKNLGYTFSVRKFDDMSYKQNSYYKRYTAYSKINYLFEDSSNLSLLANYLYSMRGNYLYWKDSRNALVPKAGEENNKVRSNRLFLSLIYNKKFSNSFTTQFKSSYYRTKFDGIAIEFTTSTANIFRNELIGTFNFSDKFRLISGLEFSYTKVNSNIFKSPDYIGTGLYAQMEYNLTDDLILNAGARYDYLKLDTLKGANAITPRAGLNYKLANDLILRSSIGTGFRVPTPSEVFTSAGVGGGIDVIENPNLTYETSLSFETGFLYNYSKSLRFDAAFYQTEYNDFIEPNLIYTGDIQFINLPKARIQGLEAIIDWDFIPQMFKLNISYNYMWSRDIQREKAMKYRPRNVLYTNLSYNHYPFEAGIDFRYWSKIEEIDDALVEPPLNYVKDGNKRVPVYVADINAGFNFFIGSLPAKTFISLKNILNYNYVEFLGNIAPLRNITLSFELFY